MKRVLIEFMDSIRNYVFESGADIAHDERESSEFVDIFLKDRPAKRHPDSNGVLPLTEEELREFEELFKHEFIYPLSGIKILNEYLYVDYVMNEDRQFPSQDSIINYKAILYLDKLFELSGGNND